MSRVRINLPIKEFQKRLTERTLNSPSGINIATKRATDFIKKRQETCFNEFIDDVNDHPVSNEIKDGPYLKNSKFIGRGNLFSFIGFDADDSPIENLISLLYNQKREVRFLRKSKDRMTFTISSPDKEYIYDRTPLPWAEGRSWVYGIERGISGLGYYLNKRSGSPSSRSGTGVQSKKRVRKTGKFNNVSYLSGLINEYIRKIKKSIKR